MTYVPFPDANITTILGLFTYGNDVTNNWFCIFIIFSLYIVMTLGMMRRDIDILKAITASSFITFMIAVMMRGAGLIKNEIVTLFVILSVFSLFLLWRKGDE